ncbi:MAG TPA: protein TolQ [Candidatus Competibacteraceae bacterium]|nr:protein TolQ [Candidatus Competibacteraceae bacterium]MCP5132723.1 protein TolQ [Gammaproteobacteria bacterium]HPF58760.1 protein TolQ [Candidatus Competibacteraceae bacterium]HRY19035.1 protein TolQ [Candidatus Competibacteraceae bacterium]
MTHEMSFWSLVANASLIVQLIMLVLALISLGSWWVIVKKQLVLSSAKGAADQFEDDFWSGIDLASLYARISRQKEPVWGMDAIFLAGFQEFLRLRAQPTADPDSVVSGAQRAMRATGSRELDELEMYLPLLATAGSTSPYIGLFGTVWGIMNAFMALGVTQQATLAQVAPGIAEALIATAMGLFAAIPAVVFYNRYAHSVDRLANRYETFMEEFSNILQRQSYHLRKNRTPSA